MVDDSVSLSVSVRVVSSNRCTKRSVFGFVGPPDGVEIEREREGEREGETLEGRVDRHTLGWEGEERVSILERRRRRPEEMRG